MTKTTTARARNSRLWSSPTTTQNTRSLVPSSSLSPTSSATRGPPAISPPKCAAVCPLLSPPRNSPSSVKEREEVLLLWSSTATVWPLMVTLLPLLPCLPALVLEVAPPPRSRHRQLVLLHQFLSLRQEPATKLVTSLRSLTSAQDLRLLPLL